MALPDIYNLPVRQVLQALASSESWVRVEFIGKEPPTKAELFRTMQLLELMHNGWDDEVKADDN